MEVRQLELDALDLSLGRLRRLPKGDVQRMAASLRSKGQLSPIVVARLDERWVLVDGFVRTLAARQLGLEHLVAEVVEVTSAQMKAPIYLRNRERGLHLLEESRLVRELVEVDGLSQVEVGDHVERHKSWVCRRVASPQCDETLLAGNGFVDLEPGEAASLQLELPPDGETDEVSVEWALGDDAGTLVFELFGGYLVECPSSGCRHDPGAPFAVLLAWPLLGLRRRLQGRSSVRGPASMID